MTSTTSSVDRGHLTCLLGASLALHAAFMLYGAHQDARSTVKYTDVDYSVFSDGARLTWLPALAGGKPSEGVLGGSWIGSSVVAMGLSPILLSAQIRTVDES